MQPRASATAGALTSMTYRDASALLRGRLSRTLLSRSRVGVRSASSTASVICHTLSQPFSQAKRWIVFSDLHVEERHDLQWQKALKEVHVLAKQFDAGCLFLGDFWHARRTVPHSTLNKVRDILTYWDVPTIAITGNHDQVDNSGESHGLYILSDISPNWLIVTRPTIINDALFVPYRANHDDVIEACREAQGMRDLKAVFAHLDIVGAHVNNTRQALEGLEPSLLPVSMPVYTGHYHRPHNVPGTNVTYIGSPYQLDFSERGQGKRVLLLDEQFSVLESIPMESGVRHHHVALQPDANVGATLAMPEDLDTRAGDKVRVGVPADFVSSTELDRFKEELQEQGLYVEVVLEHAPLAPVEAADATSASSSSAFEEASPHDILQSFFEHRARQRAAGRGGSGASDLEGALGLLEDGTDAVDLGAEVTASDAESALANDEWLQQLHTRSATLLDTCLAQHGTRRDLAHAQVALHEVMLSGFRCFSNKLKWDMAASGITALTGHNEADEGATSNGTGKTALTMAAAWAFSGDLSAWSTASGKRGLNQSSLVHHDEAVKTAVVEVRGTLCSEASGNTAVPFHLLRSVNKSGKGTKLELTVGGIDRTQGTVKATQAEIDRLFSPNLARVLFHSQQSVVSLLDSTDTTFKAAIEPLVDLELWQACVTAADVEAKITNAQFNKLEGRVEAMQGESDAAERHLEQTRASVRRAEDALHGAEDAVQCAERQSKAAAAHARDALARLVHCVAGAESVVDHRKGRQPTAEPTLHHPSTSRTNDSRDEQATTRYKAQSYEITKEQRVLEQQVARLDDDILAISTREAEASERGRLAGQSADRASAELDAARSRASLLRDVMTDASVCSLCKQPLDTQHRADAEKELKQVEAELPRLLAEAENTQQCLHEAWRTQEQLASELTRLKHERNATKSSWDQTQQKLSRLNQERMKAMAAEREELLTQFAKQREEDEAIMHLQRHLGEARSTLARSAEELERLHAGTAANAGDHQEDATLVDVDTIAVSSRLRDHIAALDACMHSLRGCVTKLQDARVDHLQMNNSLNVERGREAGAAQALEDSRHKVIEAAAARDEAKTEHEMHSLTKQAFGRGGVQHHHLTAVVQDLAAYTAQFLGQLTNKFRLHLHTQRAEASTKQQDSIQKRVSRIEQGQTIQSDLDIGSLSTGEKRRVALALTLAFNRLLQARGQCVCNTLLLDEVHANLDSEGVHRLLSLLRSESMRQHENIVLVGQADTQLLEVVDSHLVIHKDVSGRCTLRREF